MKKLISIIITLCIATIFSSCSSDNSMNVTVSVKISGTTVALHEVESEVDSDPANIDEDTEKIIYQTLIQEEAIPCASYDDTIYINIDGDFDSAMLYDNLLNDNGYSYFEDTTVSYELESINSLAMNHHKAELYHYSSDFVYEEHIRGYRIVITKGEDVVEYAFVVFVSP